MRGKGEWASRRGSIEIDTQQSKKSSSLFSPSPLFSSHPSLLSSLLASPLTKDTILETFCMTDLHTYVSLSMEEAERK